ASVRGGPWTSPILPSHENEMTLIRLVRRHANKCSSIALSWAKPLCLAGRCITLITMEIQRDKMSGHLPCVRSRREFLFEAGGGLGAFALSGLLGGDAGGAAPTRNGKPVINPLAAKPPHFDAKAKSIIFMFMVGGPSAVDLFDPKPELAKWQGQPL